MRSGRSCGGRVTPSDDHRIRGVHLWLPRDKESLRSLASVNAVVVVDEIRHRARCQRRRGRRMEVEAAVETRSMVSCGARWPWDGLEAAAVVADEVRHDAPGASGGGGACGVGGQGCCCSGIGRCAGRQLEVPGEAVVTLSVVGGLGIDVSGEATTVVHLIGF